MKKSLLLIMAFVSLSAFGQDQVFKTSPTTEEEYNYLTKGYKIQAESGLDMKKGYIFRDMGEWPDNTYNFQLKGLIREESEEIAGILVIAKSETWSGVNTYYLCIPFNNPELLKRYFADLGVWDYSMTKSYAKMISVYWTQTLLAAVEAAVETEE